MWVGVFYVVFNLILDSRKGGDFLVFLACGKFAFIWFSKTVIQASNSIVASQGLVGKINIPKSVWPMSAVQESLYRQASVYLLLFVILAMFGIYPSLTWLWLLPVLVVWWVAGRVVLDNLDRGISTDTERQLQVGLSLVLHTVQRIGSDASSLAGNERELRSGRS